MGKISVRLVFHGFIRSVPEVTSTVMTMKMMAMMALMMMPVRAMLMMAMTLRPRTLGPLGTARRAWSPWQSGVAGEAILIRRGQARARPWRMTRGVGCDEMGR